MTAIAVVLVLEEPHGSRRAGLYACTETNQEARRSYHDGSTSATPDGGAHSGPPADLGSAGYALLFSCVRASTFDVGASAFIRSWRPGRLPRRWFCGMLCRTARGGGVAVQTVPMKSHLGLTRAELASTKVRRGASAYIVVSSQCCPYIHVSRIGSPVAAQYGCICCDGSVL